MRVPMRHLVTTPRVPALPIPDWNAERATLDVNEVLSGLATVFCLPPAVASRV